MKFTNVKTIEAEGRKNSAGRRRRPRRKAQHDVAAAPAVPEAPPDFALRRKCACGGGCPNCRAQQHIQAKPKIGVPNDKYEQEAGRVADQIMRMPAPVRRPPVHSAIDSLSGGGKPLAASARAFFEPRLGYDLARVRVHTGAEAGEAAQTVQARAFTLGNHIVFGRGEYAPHSDRGRRVLAHELTHVIQQTHGDSPVQSVTQTNLTIQRKVSAAACKRTGLTPRQCDKADEDFGRAIGYLKTAIGKLTNNKPSSLKKNALKLFFNLDANTRNKQIEQKLLFILQLLQLYRQGAHFRPGTRKKCTTQGGAVTYVHLLKDIRKHFQRSFPDVAGALNKPGRANAPEAPFLIDYLTRGHFSDKAAIHLCGNDYFGADAVTRAAALIHEGAHLIGLSPTAKDDVYFKSGDFVFLTSTKLLKNADSYAQFATALGRGTLPTLPVHLSMGSGAGAIISPGKPRRVGWYVKLYFDVTARRPVLRFFYPFVRMSATFIGRPTSTSSNMNLLTGLLGGVRIQPRKRPVGTNWYVSLGAGPLFISRFTEDPQGRVKGFDVGAQTNLAGGFQWRYVGVSAGASYLYLPNVPGFKHSLQLGGRIAFTFNWP